MTDRGPIAPRPERCLERDAEFEGIVFLAGPARIDGKVRGEILGSTLRIGPSATVEARVEVDDLVVEGSLAGQVLARRRVRLCSTARVRGEVETPSLALEEGSHLDGRCTSLPDEDPAAGSP
jgi:cytoskeletal protein CcmA (bactofilin family)